MKKQRTYKLNEIPPAVADAIKKQFPAAKKVKSVWTDTKQGRTQKLIAIC